MQKQAPHQIDSNKSALSGKDFEYLKYRTLFGGWFFGVNLKRQSAAHLKSPKHSRKLGNKHLQMAHIEIYLWERKMNETTD